MRSERESPKIGAVILAAGASSRMGRPKQALLVEGQSLLKRAADAALGANCFPVITVIGANAEVSRKELAGLGVIEVFNPDWETGMGSSVSAGMRHLIQLEPATDAAILLLCDQPFVTAAVLSWLAVTYRRSGQPIVASEYGDSFGVPALFAKPVFPELLELSGTTGAKQVINKHAPHIELVPFPQGLVDLDTPADYETTISKTLEGSVFRGRN